MYKAFGGEINDLHGYKLVRDYGYDERREDYREVFEAKKNGKNYILNVGRCDHPPQGINLMFEDEVDLSKVMAKLKIGPKIVDVWRTTAVSDTECIVILCMAMPKWDTTLQELKINPKNKLLVKAKLCKLIHSHTGVLSKLHRKLKCAHGDTHKGNVVINLDRQGIPKHAALIDFECTYRLSNHKKIAKMYPGISGTIEFIESDNLY